MLPHPFTGESSQRGVTLGLLAGAYEVVGDLTKASETYEKITSLTTDRMSSSATWARSDYYLGLIAEKQGDTARAREQFGKLLEIWKDADPGQPEVADANKRMPQ